MELFFFVYELSAFMNISDWKLEIRFWVLLFISAKGRIKNTHTHTGIKSLKKKEKEKSVWYLS